MPAHYCTCGARMHAEYDHDAECMVWVCPDCYHTCVEGEE